MTQKIVAWSHSRWALYTECPQHAKFKFIDKLPEPQGPALARGSDIHAQIEKYLLKGGKVPEVAKSLAKEYRELRKMKPFVEQQLAFTKSWAPTGWFSSDAWCRIMIDAMVPPRKEPIARVYDHKTGKVKEAGEYDTQLELYNLSTFLQYSETQTAEAKLLFTDHGKVIASEPMQRKDVDAAKKVWEKRVTPMLNDTKFSPNPGRSCMWCPHAKSKGGKCKY